MATVATGPFHPVELAYRVGHGLVAFGDRSESLWGTVDPGIDDILPPALTRRVDDLRLYIAELAKRCEGDPGVETACQCLLKTLERTWLDVEAAWTSPEHVRLARDLREADWEFAWEVAQANRLTKRPVWAELEKQLDALVNELPDVPRIGARLGMCRAAIDSTYVTGLESGDVSRSAS